MPIGAIAATLGSTLATTAIQGGSQQFFNGLNQQQANVNYNMQRNHAIQDWNMQNEYNAPVNQMKRLKEAGISPYAANGNAIVAGGNATQGVRPSQMNSPSAYQVNSAQNMLQTGIAIEQAKLLQAQRNKTNAETEAINLNTGVDAETLRSRRFAEIWTAQKNLEISDASIQEKQQQVENMKAQMKQILVETQLKKIQEIHENQFLQGRNDLQTKQAGQISAQIRAINAQIEHVKFQTEKDKTFLPFQIKEIEQQIASLKLGNELKNYEAVYTPEYLNQRNRGYELDNKKKSTNSETDELKNWMDIIQSGMRTRFLRY